MFKLAAYISKTFIITWVTLVFGFLTLIGLLDSLANGADIVESGGGFSDTFRYMALRAPVIFDRIFIFTLVVAALLTFVKLIRQHELVALLGFGISASKQVLLLTPAVIGASLVSILFIDIAMAPAVRSLQTWGIGEYKIKNITPDNPLWLEDKGRIVRATQRIDYNTLGELQFFFRDDDGNVEQIWHAEEAVFKDPNWELKGVEALEVKGADGETRNFAPIKGPKIWETRQTPKSIARLAAEPRDLLIACAALMQRTGREDTGIKTLIIGITMAFIFLIFDGAMATFAASGSVAALPAIALPLLVFGVGGTYMLLRTETL